MLIGLQQQIVSFWFLTESSIHTHVYIFKCLSVLINSVILGKKSHIPPSPTVLYIAKKYIFIQHICLIRFVKILKKWWGQIKMIVEINWISVNLGMVETYIKISTWMILKVCRSLVWRKGHIAKKSVLLS